MKRTAAGIIGLAAWLTLTPGLQAQPCWIWPEDGSDPYYSSDDAKCKAATPAAKAAMEETRRLANEGEAKAQWMLGRTARNSVEAAKWYRKAAGQGHPPAQYALGEAYLAGRGVPQDYAEAARWLRKAAEQGHSRAQAELGRLYAMGKGVWGDAVKAYAWLSVAAGHEEDEDRRGKIAAERDIIASRMGSPTLRSLSELPGKTPQRLVDAQALSREYWNKYVVPYQQ